MVKFYVHNLNLTKAFKNKTSNDSDGLNMNMIKSIIQTIKTPFTKICNLSLKSGIFPNQLKVAKVIPIFKSGDKHSFNNYRPVSILPQFSKILEKIFYNRLKGFIDKHEILVESQYGFRNERSTSLALIDLLEQITNAIENKMHTIGIFIDLKKAFDTINHDLLIKKMEHFGIRGIANDWLKSYLSNRKQFANYNGTNSDLYDIECGVPQGSILGPLLFILYINDISNVSKILRLILFADDTNLFATGHDLELLCNEINNELCILSEWFKINRLSLNVKKTNYMLFSKKAKSMTQTLKIDNNVIESGRVTKFLGTNIDEKLNWKAHIDMISVKLAKSCSIIYKVNDILNTDALKSLYFTLFLPYISYCTEVWGVTFKSYLSRIVKLQKRAIRTICRVGKMHHTNELFIKLNIMKFEDLVDLEIAICMYKAKKGLLPKNIQSLFKEKTNSRQNSLRNKDNLLCKYSRTNMKSKSLSVYGVKLFNSLPMELKESKSVHLFKRNWKKMIFEKYGTMT